MNLKTSLFSLLALAACVSSARDAQASGLYFTDRGVRPMGRGGAFVAGADDLGAIWYNPAGIADAGSSVLLDAGLVVAHTTFTRRTQVADSAGVLRRYDYPEVEGKSSFVPIPTLAGSYAFGERKEFTAAFGMYAPYTAIMSYPEQVNGQPAPSRYSLVSLDGSALVVPGLYFAYKPIEQIQFGVGVQALVGTFQATVVFAASPPDRLLAAPEDPQYDALGTLKVGPIFSPSGSMGVTITPEKHFRIGLSGNLPFVVNAPAKITVRLPTAAPFDNAYQDGDGAHVRFRLPAILRAGVEARAKIDEENEVRVEITYVREFWSIHDSIDIHNDSVKLYNITGLPSPFGVSPISLPKGYQDAGSYRLGGELIHKLGDNAVRGRLGVSYDQAAVPPAYENAFANDADKVLLTIGASYNYGAHWRFDAMFGHAFIPDVTVSPADAKVPRVNPVAGNPTATESVNGGNYAFTGNITGIGANYTF